MSEVHEELRESARAVLSALGPGAAEEAVWKQVVELGWLLTAAPEELGGLGLDLSGACVLYTELGRSVAAAPFLSAMLAIDAVCASEVADRAAWIEKLTTGFIVSAPLMDLSQEFCASAVPSADKARYVLLATEDLVTLAPLAGADITPRPTWDVSRRLFDVRFKHLSVEEHLVLARGPAARNLKERLAAHRDFALGADAVGGAAALLEITVDYLKTRKQFGRPLAMFQALKHRCADLKAQTSAAEALLLDGLERGDAVSAKMAKQLACAVYARVAEEAVQLHGGIAMTAEHVCQRYLKRALLNAHLGQRQDAYALDIAGALLDNAP